MLTDDQFKNYCVIKTFGLKRSDIAQYLKTGSISVDYSEECLDGTILVLNKDAEEVDARVRAAIVAAVAAYLAGENSSCEFKVKRIKRL